MNANRIAPIAGSTWFWRGIAALEALLLAAAVAIGLAGRLPIAIAPSPAVAPVARVSAPAVAVQKGVIACKPCREEVLAATQATRITYESGASLEQQVDRRGAGPR